jgi:hypothetical protein
VDSLLIASLVFACSFIGMGLGFFIRRFLPDSHLSGESKDVVKSGFGLIATMVALVLGLLVASAKSAFDSDTAGFEALSTNIIMLDRALAQYGPEAKPAREALRGIVASMIDQLWPANGSGPTVGVDSRELTVQGTSFVVALRNLAPKNEMQKAIQAQALQVSSDLGKTRWSLSQPAAPLLPTPFLVVLLFWLGMLFGGFGLLTPRNTTVVVTLLICALSLSGAIFLIVDLGEPNDGLIRVSSASLRFALSHLGQ